MLEHRRPIHQGQDLTEKADYVWIDSHRINFRNVGNSSIRESGKTYKNPERKGSFRNKLQGRINLGSLMKPR